MIYDSLGTYLAQNSADLQAENTALKNIISGLQVAMLDNVASAGKSEFMLNNGQTTIKGVNRDPAAIMKTIQMVKQLLTDNENKINGRTYVMKDAKNFTNNGWY
jgi:hypothetical protein